MQLAAYLISAMTFMGLHAILVKLVTAGIATIA